jgi:hypothetical protein
MKTFPTFMRQTPVGIDDKQVWMENEKETKWLEGSEFIYLPGSMHFWVEWGLPCLSHCIL